MDTLVARYSRSSFQDEMYSEQQQRELSQCLPPLSLKFDLPPLSNVSSVRSNLIRNAVISLLDGSRRGVST
jgi:hypothetical protein